MDTIVVYMGRCKTNGEASPSPIRLDNCETAHFYIHGILRREERNKRLSCWYKGILGIENVHITI